MSGQGTTDGGLFRYPYEYTEVADLLSKDHNAFVAAHMDRDRALEDYLSNTHSRFPYVVVASDGTGDYLSIKTAVEAMPAPASTGGQNLIFVKKDTSGYSDTGAVATAEGARITIIAGMPTNENLISSIETTGYQHWQEWTFAGFDALHAANITLIGFQLNTGTSQVIADSVSAFVLNSLNCYWAGSGNWCGTAGQGNARLVVSSFVDCDVANAIVRNALPCPYINAWRTRFTNFAPGTTVTSDSGPISTYDDDAYYLYFNGCTIQGIGDCTLTQERYPTQGMMFDNCQIAGTSLTFRMAGRLTISNCTAGPTTLQVNGSQGNHAGDLTYSVSGNMMPDTHLSIGVYNVTNQVSGVVTGTYNKMTLSSPSTSNPDGRYATGTALVNLHANANSQTLLTITGKYHMVIAHLAAETFSSVTGVNVSGSGNRVIYTSDGLLGTEVTDTGTGNYTNTMTPGGPAGGNLAGTYPNPTFSASAFGAAGYPVDVAAAEADGSALTGARSDHVHAHGTGYLPNAHHNQAHAINGADHTASGLTTGHVLTATSATTFAFQALVAYLSAHTNIMSANQATLETDTTGWAVDANCTIARSTSQSAHGVASLALTRL